MTRTNTTDAIPDGLRRAARRLVCDHYGDDVTAWLVGSRTTGDHDADSDLDVVVEVEAMHRKQTPHEQGFGAGFYHEDAWRGVDIDITEDADGPIRGAGRGPIRLDVTEVTTDA